MDWDKATAELTKPLDPKHVKPPKQFGPKGDYIEGWHAIKEANRIFGFGAWSYEIVSLDKADLTLGEDSKGKPQWQAAYTSIVRVRVGDVVREDVGFGSGFAKQVGDAVEGATKEAVTDALKRCLRTFGNPFGLALYDKDKTDVKAPPPGHAETRDRIKAAIADRKTQQKLKELWEHRATVGAVDALPQPMQLELQEAYNKQWNRLPDDPALQAPAA